MSHPEFYIRASLTHKLNPQPLPNGEFEKGRKIKVRLSRTFIFLPFSKNC
jgi:hypothetical protein